MSNKYIVIEVNGLEVPVIFPSIVKHTDIAGLNNPHKVVSAGFCLTIPDSQPSDGEGKINVTCYGQSVGLRISSREEEDKVLISKMLNS